MQGPKINKDGKYEMFLREFMPALIGYGVWLKNKTNRTIPEFVSVSTEAFGLLVLENAWDHWIDVNNDCAVNKRAAEKSKENGNQTGAGKQVARPTKYSNGGKGAEGSQGWKPEGINRYNALFSIITLIRDDENAKELYRDIKWRERNSEEERKNKKKRKKDDGNVQETVAMVTNDRKKATELIDGELFERDGKRYMKTPMGDIEIAREASL